MVSFLADENFDNRIVRGMLLVSSEIDVVRVQDTEYYKAHDREILHFAFAENRALLTHDINTMPVFFRQNNEAGIHNPAVFIVTKSTPLGKVIEDLSMVAVCSNLDEWIGTLRILPL